MAHIHQCKLFSAPGSNLEKVVNDFMNKNAILERQNIKNALKFIQEHRPSVFEKIDRKQRKIRKILIDKSSDIEKTRKLEEEIQQWYLLCLEATVNYSKKEGTLKRKIKRSNKLIEGYNRDKLSGNLGEDETDEIFNNDLICLFTDLLSRNKAGSVDNDN